MIKLQSMQLRTARIIQRTANNTTVIRCKIKSSPRAFCLPNNVSAPPEMAPDNPALLPDCNNNNKNKSNTNDY